MDEGPRTISTLKPSKPTAVTRPSSRRIAAVPCEPKSEAVPYDEIEIARRRMQHLRYRNVEPLPNMHFVIGKVDRHLTAAQRANYQQIALHVLAVQMWQTTAKSALR
ncbi:MAG TPA: hypothetical protein VEU53_03260 [Stellaceae bacterium]|nr:hypothetical protein [Stellaceae bacterium]